MEKILTIVIPTYNMQDYLRRCLDSLIVPEELMKQLEVLVVNDGSKDNSSAIAHEYQDKYPDTFRVIDKENGNYGSCVNRGLKDATGKYIKILDADDWFDKCALELFLTKLTGLNVDVVYTPFNSVYCANDKIDRIVKEEKDKFDYEANVDLMHEKLDGTFFHMHSLTYKTSLLKGISYRQEEKICYSDTEYVFYPLCHAHNMICLNITLYQYYIGREGQSTSVKTMAKNFSHFQRILSNLIAYKKDKTIPAVCALCGYYYVVLFRYMIDIHLFATPSDESQDSILRGFVEDFSKIDKLYENQVLAINLKGFKYVSWWYKKSFLNNVRLFLFSKLKSLKD